MAIDRENLAVARKTAEWMYPEAKLRREMLAFFAEALRTAHGLGASRWSVTLFKRRIRLIVGKLLAVELAKGRVRIGIPPSKLADSVRTKLDEIGEWSDEFATFPVTRLLELPAEVFLEQRGDLAAAFADFIRIAADWGRTASRRSHSPGVLAFLAEELSAEIPRPVHQDESEEPEDEEDDDAGDEPVDTRAVAMNAPKVLFEKVDYSLDNLLTYVETGDIGLPDIQRPFVWSMTKVRDLLDSMYRGYPVGYLLFWANSDVQNARQIGTGAKTHKVPHMLIVDGQQRLTSLFAVFKSLPVLDEEFAETKIEIAFRPRDSRFEVTDAAIRRDPEFIPNISELWSSKKPVHRLVREFLQNLEEKRGLDPEDEDALSNNIDRLYDLRNYQFTGLKIMPMVDEEAVANIFVRINSEGVKLNQADFILTLLSVFWEQGRSDLEQFAREAKVPSVKKASPFNSYLQPSPDQLLRVSVALAFLRAKLRAVYQVLRGKDPVTGAYSIERREQQFERLREAQEKVLDLTNWHRFLNALVGAGYRSGEVISSDTAILYAYAVYLLGKYQANVEDQRLQILVSRWFFMISLTGRYSTSPESMMEEDLGRLRGLTDANSFVAAIDHVIDSTLTNDFWLIGLVNDLETSSARSPALFAYYAALNRLGAPVLFSRKLVSELLDPAVRPLKKALDRHHLFPRAHLERKGIDDTKVVNQVANYALLEWPANIDISAAPPEDYVPEMRKHFRDSEWQRMCYLHALPPDWEKMPYDAFLKARRSLIAEIIRRGFESIAGEVEGAAAQLQGSAEERKAWELIETVELRLRSVVRARFEAKWKGDADAKLKKALGDDAWSKIEQNLAKGQYRLSPATDGGRAEILDFCYLGQLTNLMMWGEAWDLFRVPFKDKRELQDLAGDIIPVRNDRAHFRPVPPKELQRCKLACDDLLVHLERLEMS